MKRELTLTLSAVMAMALLLALAGSRAEVPAESAAAPQAPEAAEPANPAPPPLQETKPPEPAKPDEHELENLEQLDPGTTVAILGKKVRDASGKDMGLVVDVLVDRDAVMRAAVIDFGGFLGVGSRKIAIDWRLLQFDPADREAPIVLGLNRAEVQAAPEYKPSAQPGPVVLVGPPAVGTSVPPGGQ